MFCLGLLQLTASPFLPLGGRARFVPFAFPSAKPIEAFFFFLAQFERLDLVLQDYHRFRGADHTFGRFGEKAGMVLTSSCRGHAHTVCRQWPRYRRSPVALEALDLLNRHTPLASRRHLRADRARLAQATDGVLADS